MTGEQASEARQKAGLKQREFWKRIGLSAPTGCRYERGERRIPAPVETLIELAYGPNPMATLAKLRGESANTSKEVI